MLLLALVASTQQLLLSLGLLLLMLRIVLLEPATSSGLIKAIIGHASTHIRSHQGHHLLAIIGHA
jgi:hypothetical protein